MKNLSQDGLLEGSGLKETGVELLRGACPELNDETLRFTQGDKVRRAQNDKNGKATLTKVPKVVPVYDKDGKP